MIVALLVLLLAAPAAAHVTVTPEVARPGDTVELTFHVQNERADATTVGVDLFLPPGVPAEIAERPGWSITNRGKGEIAFVAEDPAAAIRPGRTEDFQLTLGPLPQGDRIVVKALQYYADGQIVRWIQTSGPDDERPAAILDLSGRGEGEDAGGSLVAWTIAGLGVAALVAVGLLARRRRR